MRRPGGRKSGRHMTHSRRAGAGGVAGLRL